MTTTVEMPVWALVLLVAFAAVTFASHFLFPSVRWFFRKRMMRLVGRLNTRLARPIEPFKLARRYDMIQRLIYDPDVGRAIAAHAKEHGIPENVAFETAQRYAGEIVPSFSAWTYFRFGSRVARWLSQTLYHVRVVHHADGALEQIDPDATVVFVMNHRSNMDYVLVTYLAARQGAISYAVGEWARIWPLSRLIRAMGAYFIRRKSANDLYRAILARYIRMATDAGVTQAVFPEGGLSLTGQPSEPKLGILKYLLDRGDTPERNVVFVPVALNYDRVLEDRILIRAESEGARRFRARVAVVVRFVLKRLWLRLTGRYRRFGYAGVSFGAPLSLESFDGDLPALADELMRRIASEVPVLPVPLVATALLQAGGREERLALEMRMKDLIAELDEASLYLPRGNRGYTLDVALRALGQRGLVQEDHGVISVTKGQEAVLAFYAASIKHLFCNCSK
ncbi:1-acyl-sn-glycerol-3-phosphate acyltransferase [Thalassovita sp.]|uniref:1-acyl-sn-glycerol-3-phosphate acyltransferase n=1 Tax=Thalassovita sp. TaxID=1979401 RepID=UPI0028811C8C|nr:1-acyl-sn-glycerol-3-phosphate acyltransferase [Thalassovita sp.]MDF1802893.1 1-acyl-sn-glycerol-3-phosphate acyltransferase [Thalassovita sp.]